MNDRLRKILGHFLKDAMQDIDKRSMIWDEIFGVSQISWEDSPWKQLSLVNDAEVISLSPAKVYVFSDSVL